MKNKKIYLYLFVSLFLIGVAGVGYAARAPVTVPIEPALASGIPEFSGADFNAKAKVEERGGLRIITLEVSELKPECSYSVYQTNPISGDREYLGYFISGEDGSVLHRFIMTSGYKAVDIYAMAQRDPGLQTFDYTYDPHQSMWSSWDYFTAPTCTAAGKDIKILSLNLEGIK